VLKNEPYTAVKINWRYAASMLVSDRHAY